MTEAVDQEQPREFGKYTLLNKIGSGGMAEIYRSELEGIDGFRKVLVVKKILPKYANNRQFITMFVQEAKVCSGMHHANVVQIYELGEVGGEYYIAMEFVEGQDLLKLLTRASKLGRRVPDELCCYIVMEIAKGLSYAHSATGHDGMPLNIVHLDCSPSNILISNKGEVKLTDFGVARATVEGSSPSTDDRLKGKLGYMSPEQVTGKPVDHRSDIFSLGIILYELFTLKRLFLGRSDIETLSNIRDANIEPRLKKHPEIPPPVADVIRQALRVNVDTRYQDAHGVEEDLSQHLFEMRKRVTANHLGTWLQDLFDLPVPDGPPIPRTRPKDVSAPADTAVGHQSAVTRAQQKRKEPPTSAPPIHQPEKTAVSQPGATARPAPQAAAPPGELPPAGNYTFKRPDEEPFGPITQNNVRNLLRSRAIAPDELVSRDGGEFKPAVEDSKVGPYVQQLGRGEPRAAQVGVFGSANAARLMARMAAFRRNGRFRLQRDGSHKEIYFRKGRPIHIATNAKDELFGSMLVSQGVVTEEQLQAAVDVSKAQDNIPLGTALVQAGALDQMELFRQLDVQFREKFMQVFAWEDATYEFHVNMEPPPSAVPYRLDPYPLITEGVRRFVQPEALETYFATAATKTIRLIADPPFDPSQLAFAPREHRVRHHVASRPLKLPDLVAQLGQTDEDRQTVLFVLFVLHQCELIRMR